MYVGLPHLEEKRLNAAIKDSDVKSDTSSRCIVLIARTNKQTYKYLARFITPPPSIPYSLLQSFLHWQDF